MLEGLSVNHILNYARKKWQMLPDGRNHDNNNLTYPIVDVALSALSVFSCNPHLIFPQYYRHKEETDWVLK